MNVSFHVLFLARAMGLYFLMMSVIMMCRGSYYRGLIMNINPASGSVMVVASLGLMFGLTLTLIHHVWMWNFEGLITLIAWGVLVKSLLWLAFPECMVNYTKKMYSCCWMYYLMALFMGFIGLVLIAHGFYMVQVFYA
jgi:hypothetical protein